MGKTQAQHVHCVLDPACASRRLFAAISGKWSPLVVMALKDGGEKASRGAQAGTRGYLPEDAHPDFKGPRAQRPRRAEGLPRSPAEGRVLAYPLGRSLQPLLEAICQWSERHLEEVKRARLGVGETTFRCGA